jgi:cyclohexyl-isocyanide hydratase
MNRRDFTLGLAAAGAVTSALTDVQAQIAQSVPAAAAGIQQVAMLAHPDMTAIDLIGPQLFLNAMGNVKVHLVWKSREPVITDSGVAILPTMTFAECPANLTILFVPGGLKGTTALMNDAETIAFLKDRGSRAEYVTSVCTGGLLLGAAGLLKGYRATAHWYVRDILPLFGAVPAAGRVVEDRNRITGGGATAGIDFGMTLVARLRGEDHAKRLQLVFEYDPQPPFNSGSPEKAEAALTQDVLSRRAPVIAAAKSAAELAAARLAL